MSVVERLDAFQARHPAAALPLGVAYKFFDDRGPHLAALITYYGFVSLFPLLLILTSALGFLLDGDPALQQRILESALSDFPLLGTVLAENIGSFQGSGGALVVGILGTLYGGLGVMQAAQAALNRIYAVPRFAQPNPFLSRARSLLLVVVLGMGAVASTALTAVVSTFSGLLPVPDAVVTAGGTLLSFSINVGIFLVLYQVLVARRLGWRNVAVGAAIAAVLWELLHLLGVYYFGSYVLRSSDVYGVFGVILGLVVWIYLQALVVVLAAEINVVRHRRLYPRSLLTPFTDDVDLTPADIRVYTGYAQSERYKGFERVETSFRKDAPVDPPADGFPGDVAEDEAEAAGDPVPEGESLPEGDPDATPDPAPEGESLPERAPGAAGDPVPEDAPSPDGAAVDGASEDARQRP
ncbi:YihY/virulence factor BrkB family protein [Blastococcus xanthinilyticus]|uniref:YihY family inner membrane protein n=1 Tax=Blastococcus xanthinilyticus TaxID=1564164 RepID=A0A5S5D1D9_9ACTN|nr:YihY/virulence factor BrkB family protein [Blastococcus xanthinilyticus]TYP88926.1 YihY family inner membrane protein [Blastococcus xanthinilyticus]